MSEFGNVTSDMWKDSTIAFGETLTKIELQLESLWTKIGLNRDMVSNRVNTVFAVLNEVLDKMLLEEQNLLDLLKNKVLFYREKVQQLFFDLHMEYKESKSSDSLILQEHYLRNMCNDLEARKRKSINEWKQILELHKNICSRLESPTTEIPIQGIPTKNQINEMLDINENLDKKLKARQARFLVYKTEITEMVSTMEYSSDDPFFQSIIHSNSNCEFVFSKSNMNKLSVYKDNIEKEFKEIKSKIDRLWSSLDFLWSILNVTENHITEFKNSHNKYTTSVAIELDREVSRLRTIRLENLSEYIPKVRQKLEAAWDKNRFGSFKRQQFLKIFGDRVSEESVSAHEDALLSAIEYYKNNSHILDLIQKRDQLFEHHKRFELGYNNPDKYHNRGGALLQEEKLRRSVNKELPVVEDELLKLSKEWEIENNVAFLVDDKTMNEYIIGQHDAIKLEKEERKRQRLIDKTPTTPNKKSVNTTFCTPRLNSTICKSRTPATDIANRSRRMCNFGPLTPVKRRSSMISYQNVPLKMTEKNRVKIRKSKSRSPKCPNSIATSPMDTITKSSKKNDKLFFEQSIDPIQVKENVFENKYFENIQDL